MSTFHRQIVDWLGVRPVQMEGQVLQIVEQQLPTPLINRLLTLGLTCQEIDALVIPLRTLQHRRSKREKLTVEESDRVLRIVRVLSQAETVYGSRDHALCWLRRPAPISALSTAKLRCRFS